MTTESSASDSEPGPLGSLSERELLERWISSKDAAAATELYQRYIRRLLQRVRTERSESYSIESAYHDAFGTFLRRAPTMPFRFDHDDWLWRLLGTIAKRKRLAKLRPGKALTGGDPLSDLAGLERGDPSPDEVATYNELRSELWSILKSRERIYLEMREQEFSQKEIAVELKVDVRQVRRIARSVELKATRLFKLQAGLPENQENGPAADVDRAPS